MSCACRLHISCSNFVALGMTDYRCFGISQISVNCFNGPQMELTFMFNVLVSAAN